MRKNRKEIAAEGAKEYTEQISAKYAETPQTTQSEAQDSRERLKRAKVPAKSAKLEIVDNSFSR